MAEKLSLAATARAATKHSAREARAGNRVPGVVYGHGTDSTPISVDGSEMLKTFRKAGQSTLISLEIDGQKKAVLIHQVSLHPVRSTIWHVDFFAVNLKQKTTVHVPFSFAGESAAVKNLGGIFTVEHEGVDLRCLPNDIPHDLPVDISAIENFQDSIKVADISLPAGVELIHPETDGEMVICRVAPPKIVEEVSESTEETDESAEAEKTEDSQSGEK